MKVDDSATQQDKEKALVGAATLTGASTQRPAQSKGRKQIIARLLPFGKKKGSRFYMQREELLEKWTTELNNTNLEGLELLTRLFGGISEIEMYNIHTTPERIAEIKVQQAEAEARKQAEREAEQQKKPSKYTLNATMSLLGKQCVMSALCEYRDMFDDVIKAHPHEGTFDICINMFSLGIICGKRIDRKRRKDNAVIGA